jgi:hypothetical protein
VGPSPSGPVPEQREGDTGWTAVEAALDAFDAIERELAEQVGDHRMRGLRRTLELLTDEEPAAASPRR